MRESDCYALGMVILEVLSGQAPFPHYNGLILMRKVIQGERPGRPQGVEGAWFTDDLWEMLGQCWLPQAKDRPAIEAVLECLKRASTVWQPLLPNAYGSLGTDTGGGLCSTVGGLCMFLRSIAYSRTHPQWGSFRVSGAASFPVIGGSIVSRLARAGTF